MKAIILAAGEGTRLGPFTQNEPKVMIPVANRPILEYVVEALVRTGIRDIVMVVGYKRERIQTHFEDGKKFGAHIAYVAQKKQLGTAHALLEARGSVEEDFLVFPGDNVIDARIVQDLLEHRRGLSVLVTESDDPTKYGVVKVTDGLLEDLVEKPEERVSNIINTGIYAMDPSAFDELEGLVTSGKPGLDSFIQMMAKKAKVRAIPTQGTWMDAGYPWDLLRVNATVLPWAEERVGGKVEQNVVLRGKVSVGDGTLLRSGTYIQGPVAIGEGCDVGPNVTIQASTSIGHNVRIGPSSVVEESILMGDVALGPHSYLSHSVLAQGVRAGPHFSAAAGPANVRVEGEWYEVPVVGSFIGDDTEISGGVVAEPGVVVGARVRVGPHVTLRGSVPSGGIVV